MPFDVQFEPETWPLHHASAGDCEGIVAPATHHDADAWQRDWRPMLRRARSYDSEWPWREHIERAATESGRLVLSMRRGEVLEGLLSITLQGAASRLALGRDMLYIEYLGVAPQNQLPPVGTRAVGGIGTIMLATTLNLAHLLGCDYRVGLHSKPDSERFYRRREFKALGTERTEDGDWTYFEIGPQEARVLLRGGGD